jgi:dTDP-4-dehydrorhamnose 3,5-epimerase
MEVERTAIPGVVVIDPVRRPDSRGFFSETYVAPVWRAAGVSPDFIQDNHAFSAQRGTLRGLHWQAAPKAQAKLVRVLRGAIFDVVVDLRRDSPTFRQHLSFELSAANWRQLYVPVGLAHGYCTLERDTEVLYKVDQLWDRSTERGIRWDDPDVGIAWPAAFDLNFVSEKDWQLPRMADLNPDEFFACVSS